MGLIRLSSQAKQTNLLFESLVKSKDPCNCYGAVN